MARHSVLVPVVLLALASAACSRSERAPADTDASAVVTPVAVDGRRLFLERCSVCHGKDAEGAQGPTLRGLAGRQAGTQDPFGYTAAMRALKFRWDVPTLDRFLEAPTEVVPGTAMVLAVPVAAERKALVMYLLSLEPIPEVADNDAHDAGPPPAPTPGLHVAKDALGGFRSDAPGVRRRITVADLPAPFATKARRNSAKVVEPPAGAAPKLPAGFHATVVTTLGKPRLLRTAPNGDLFVAESFSGQIMALHMSKDGTTVERTEAFAKGLDQPFGIAFFPPGPSPQWIYIAEQNKVIRFPYANGDLTPRGTAEVMVATLAPSTGGHAMRNLAFSNDGKRMFVAVGSESNVAEDLPARSPDEIRTFEASHGLGATWGPEESRADVLVFDPDGKNGRTFATGIRNCSGMTVQPKTGIVWCSTNERDGLGDDLVPDYVTRVRENAFYGWPWYYLGDHEDPRHAGKRTDLAGKVTVPDVLLQPHSAPLQITFYDGAMFPADYRGNALVALHGSWNRGGRTGYKVVRVLTKDGVPTGEYEDFMTGFVIDDAQVWARPVGITVGKDGALFVSDDANGRIWRVTYSK
ncbi:PQQ-dependent sugar dehydrogenase [Pendulispora brunnea]|uniref:PQQ-dependent sugar dehydrogenase n=1 Tax=Pendulispora brunnea TaxID=2905690 RepID=A0ABZ2K5K2_9BACT